MVRLRQILSVHKSAQLDSSFDAPGGRLPVMQLHKGESTRASGDPACEFRADEIIPRDQQGRGGGARIHVQYDPPYRANFFFRKFSPDQERISVPTNVPAMGIGSPTTTPASNPFTTLLTMESRLSTF